jgi:cytoskeletal protein CcmA (bactofilin family)
MSAGSEKLIADSIFNDDVFVSGGKVKMESRIAGDLFAFCQELVLSDSVGGSLNSFCMVSQVLAPVGQSFRGAGLSTTCNAPIGRNILFFGRNVTIGPNAKIGQNGDLFCQRLVFQGEIDGDLRIEAEEAVISGVVCGDLYFKEGLLTISSDATIAGNIFYKSSQKAEISNSATINGEVNWEQLEDTGQDKDDQFALGKIFAWVFSARGYLMLAGIVSLITLGISIIPLPAWLSIILYVVVLLISGNILILLTRERTRATVQMIGNKLLPSLGLGFVIFFVVPVVSIIILLTFVGAPLGIALLFIFGVAAFAGSVYTSTFLGEKIWGLLGSGKCSEHLCYSTGVILLIVFSFIPVIGYILITAAFMIGLGGLALTIKYNTPR